MTNTLRILDIDEINAISGGFVCGGLCVLGGIGAGIAFFTGGVAVGQTVAKL